MHLKVQIITNRVIINLVYIADFAQPVIQVK